MSCIATESRGLRLKPPEALPAEAGLRLRRCCDLKALRILVPFLILDVLLDRLLIHRADSRAEISARPQMLAPNTACEGAEIPPAASGSTVPSNTAPVLPAPTAAVPPPADEYDPATPHPALSLLPAPRISAGSDRALAPLLPRAAPYTGTS